MQISTQSKRNLNSFLLIFWIFKYECMWMVLRNRASHDSYISGTCHDAMLKSIDSDAKSRRIDMKIAVQWRVTQKGIVYGCFQSIYTWFPSPVAFRRSFEKFYYFCINGLLIQLLLVAVWSFHLQFCSHCFTCSLYPCSLILIITFIFIFIHQKIIDYVHYFASHNTILFYLLYKLIFLFIY